VRERGREKERAREGEREGVCVCVPYRLHSDVEGWHIEGLEKDLMCVT